MYNKYYIEVFVQKLSRCATQKPAASSSEAASTAPAESSVVEETTPEEVPSEVTDVDEAAAEDLLLSTETMHYSADDEDGVVTVHKYDENGNEVFMREIDKASDMDTVTIKELDENGNVLKMTSYLNGEQNYLYTQVFNDHGDLIERDDEDGNPSIVCQYTYDDNGRKLSEESYTVSDGEQYLNYSTAYTYDDPTSCLLRRLSRMTVAFRPRLVTLIRWTSIVCISRLSAKMVQMTLCITSA